MVKGDTRRVSEKPISLLLVEGKTDELFYGRVKNIFLGECRITIRNLAGLYNINKKVVTGVVDYVQQHKEEKVRAYCCLDRDSRYGTIPEFDIEKVKECIRDNGIKRVLSIDRIIATQPLESWFLHDIDGIYTFLRVPKSQRKLKAFSPPEKFSYRDVLKLFERYGKTYMKGERAENFIKHLDISKIASDCKELKGAIELIRSRAHDSTNHLFPLRNRGPG